MKLYFVCVCSYLCIHDLYRTYTDVTYKSHVFGIPNTIFPVYGTSTAGGSRRVTNSLCTNYGQTSPVKRLRSDNIRLCRKRGAQTDCCRRGPSGRIQTR